MFVCERFFKRDDGGGGAFRQNKCEGSVTIFTLGEPQMALTWGRARGGGLLGPLLALQLSTLVLDLQGKCECAG